MDSPPPEVDAGTARSRKNRKMKRHSVEISSLKRGASFSGSTESLKSSGSSSASSSVEPAEELTTAKKKNTSKRKSISIKSEEEIVVHQMTEQIQQTTTTTEKKKSTTPRSRTSPREIASPPILSPRVSPKRAQEAPKRRDDVGSGRRRSHSFNGTIPDLALLQLAQEPQISSRRLLSLIASPTELSASKKSILNLATHFYCREESGATQTSPLTFFDVYGFKLLFNDGELMHALVDDFIGAKSPISRRKIAQFISSWLEIDATALAEDAAWMAEFRRLLAFDCQDEIISRTVQYLSSTLKDSSTRFLRHRMAARAAYPPAELSECYLSLHDADATKIAQQYSMYLMRLFLAIPSSVLCSAKRARTDPNVRAFNECAAMMSQWANASIQSEATDIGRTRVLAKLVDLTRRLREVQNFSGLMSIVETVKPWRDTDEWKLVQPHLRDVWDDLVPLMNQENKFANLRRTICDAAPPCIPHLKIFIEDIQQMENSYSGGDKCSSSVPLRKALALGRVGSILHTMKVLNAETNFDWDWDDSVASLFLNGFVKFQETSSGVVRTARTAGNASREAMKARDDSVLSKRTKNKKRMSKRHSVANIGQKISSGKTSSDSVVSHRQKARSSSVLPSTSHQKIVDASPSPTPGSIMLTHQAPRNKVFKSMENLMSLFRRGK